MPWVQLDDNFSEHPKVLDLSNEAFRLHVRALCYCNRLLTDGHVPKGALSALASHCENPGVDGTRIVTELIAKKLWRGTRSGWTIKNYLDWNLTREQIEARREAKKAAGRKGAERRWKDGTSHSSTNGTSHSNRMADRNAPKPLPSVSKNLNQEERKEEAEHNTAQAIHRLLQACGEEQGQQAHLECLTLLAQGASEWDFDAARVATQRKRATHPWRYARHILHNRLADKEPAA